MKIKSRFYFLLLGVVGFLTLWIIFRDDLFLTLFILICLITIASYISARISLRGIILQRSSRFQKMNVGNYFEDHFDIENKYPLWKQWLEIRDYSGISGNPEEVRILTGIDAKKIRTFNTYTFLQKRGEFTLGPMQLISGDFFGFFELSKQLENSKRLVVLPRIIDLDTFAHLPAYLSGGKELKVASTETTPFAAGVREYFPGDSLRRIHWPTTARKNKLMVKEFDRDPQMNTWLMIDCAAKNHFESPQADSFNHPSDYWSVRRQTRYELPCSTFEYGVTAAASITKYFIEHNFGVGIITSSSQKQILVSDHGYRQLGRALDTLASLQADGDIPFGVFIGEYIKQIDRGSTVIFISTLQNEEMMSIIDLALARGLEPVYIWMQKASFLNDDKKPIEQENILGELVVREVPVYQIRYGADLKECLENGMVLQNQGISVD
ncbi:MAG: DUF58 domain-containing protein [Anaerolineaceae bacterium]